MFSLLMLETLRFQGYRVHSSHAVKVGGIVTARFTAQRAGFRTITGRYSFYAEEN